MELRKGMEGQFNIVVLRNNLKTEIEKLEGDIDWGVCPEHDYEDLDRMKSKVEALREVVETLEWYISEVHKLPRL